MAKMRLPPDVVEFFRKEGAKGGRLGGSKGGKKSAANLTPEERVARARKAGLAAVASRKAKLKRKGKGSAGT